MNRSPGFVSPYILALTRLGGLMMQAVGAAGGESVVKRLADKLEVPLAAMPLLEKEPAMDRAPDFKNWGDPWGQTWIR